jgi:Protein of unknown function (DUF2637)
VWQRHRLLEMGGADPLVWVGARVAQFQDRRVAGSRLAVRVAAYVHACANWRTGAWGPAVSGQADRWIRWTAAGCVALLALIVATVSYLHMLVELYGQPGWVAALTPFSVDGMIVAASTTLLADSRWAVPADQRRPGGPSALAIAFANSAGGLTVRQCPAEPG